MSDIKGSTIVKEGFLVKSPPQDRLMAAWHKRYFVLWSGGFMEYYSSSDKKPQDYLKTIDLNGCEDMVAPYPISGRTFIIKVALTVKGKNRDYFFDCENQQTMDDWVGVLADVCGFTAVDCEVDEDNFDAAVSPVLKSLSPPPAIPPFRDPSSSPSLANRPKLRPPLPPPKSQSPLSHSFNGAPLYEDPNTVDFSIEEDLYDCSISDSVLQKLNTQPPPVWKNPANSIPPPLPPTRNSRRFTRSSFSPPQDYPPSLPDRPGRNEPSLSNKRLPKIPKFPFSKPNKPQPVNNRPTTPPPLPTNFKADLGSKLMKRNNVTRSWNEDEQLQYEDIDNRLSRGYSPRARSTNSESAESDTGSYVDCDPNQPQNYLDYNEANSLLRNDSPPLERDWSALAPPLPSRTPIVPTPDSDDEAPPVPRRHPDASGRTLPRSSTSGRFSPHNVNNPLPLPPRAKSPAPPEDDDAPPVPVRRPDSSFRPPLTRPHSEKSIHSLHPPIHRGSAPTIGSRQPIPPPKTNYTETDDSDIFKDVQFSNKQRNNHRDASPARKQSPQPSWKTDSVSTRSNDNKPSRTPMPPLPKPAPLPKPPTSAKPKVTPPPPVSNKPKNSPIHNPPPTTSGLGSRNVNNVNRSAPPLSPRHKKKFPEPPPGNKLRTTTDPRPPAAPKNPGFGKKPPEPSEPRRKLDTSFLNKLSEATSNPPLKPKKPSPEPPPFKLKKPSPEPATLPYSAETRRKFPNNTASKPEHRNGPGIAKKPVPPTPRDKPMPPTPREKPLANKFQNSELAACLQSNNFSSQRPSSSGHKPMAPPKPKPMLPPSYR